MLFCMKAYIFQDLLDGSIGGGGLMPSGTSGVDASRVGIDRGTVGVDAPCASTEILLALAGASCLLTKTGRDYGEVVCCYPGGSVPGDKKLVEGNREVSEDVENFFRLVLLIDLRSRFSFSMKFDKCKLLMADPKPAFWLFDIVPCV